MSHTATSSRTDISSLGENTAETEALASYRAPSIVAILALLFGLASPLALVAPLLMVLPLVGAVLALVALGRVAASEGQLVGRGAALWGLALSVVFALASPVRERCTAHWFSQQAQPLAERWLQLLVAGDTNSAFHLTTAAERPVAPDPRPGMPEPEVTPLEQFEQTPTIEQLANLGEANVRLVEELGYQPSGHHRHRGIPLLGLMPAA